MKVDLIWHANANLSSRSSMMKPLANHSQRPSAMPAGKINEEEESESSAFERKYPPLADPALEHSTPVLNIVMIVGVRVKREFKFGRQTAQYTTSLHLHSSMGGVT